MRIHTKIKFEWDGEKYVETYEEGYEFPVNGIALCKGATQQQNDLAASQTGFYNTLTQDYGQQFANQSSILNSLNQSLSPTVAAGPSQFGYSNAQTNALNSTALQGTAQTYQNAQKALQNQQAQQGGGNMALPSGVAAQNAAALAASGANQTSSELLGIQNAGYAQGNQNYNNAISSLGSVASQYNPTGYSNSATGAGSSAASELNTIQQENTAASPLSIVGGLLGGIAGAASKFAIPATSNGAGNAYQNLDMSQGIAQGGSVSPISSDTSTLGLIGT